MNSTSWVKEFSVPITVCDREGVIIEMNNRSIETFKKDGGSALIGTNLLDCHPEPSRSKVEDQLRTPQTNIYTIEKEGKKKLIYQSPWYKDGIFAGLVELSIELPENIPHFKRD